MHTKHFFVLCYFFFTSLYGQQRIEQVVILGSGPAGMSAAIYTSRANLSTLVIEAEPPDQISMSYTIDNYPGFPEGIEGYQLQEKMREQAMGFGARIQEGLIVGVDLSKRPYAIQLEDEETPIFAETVIIALGSSTTLLGLESEKALVGNGVSVCSTCDAVLYEDKEVVVVGDGVIALAEALSLANFASKVTIIPQGNDLIASKNLLEKVQANAKIHFLWNCIVEDISDPAAKKVTGVFLRDISNNQKQFYPCDGVFVAVGVKPNTELFQGQLELDRDGFIITNSRTMHTSVPGVFAVGNVTDSRYRQAITAAGMGGMAGIDAFLYIKSLDEEDEAL